MVSDPPTRRERAGWRTRVALALSTGVIGCSGLLDIPGDPYLAEPPAPAPSTQPPVDAPAASAALEPSTSPELEVDDVQGGGGAGTIGDPGDADAPPGTVDLPDAGAVDAAPPLAAPDAALACPAGTTLGPSGRCYIAVTATLTWPEAQTRCNALGAGWDLAAVHDAPTNAFLGTLIDVEAWVGASDAESEGAWFWVIDGVPFWSGDGDTGVTVNGAFEIWAGGEPNGEVGSNCARLVPNPPRWADLECDTLRASLCEGPAL